MKIFVIAGEPSGDLLGGRLMQALKIQQDGIVFTGVGGPRMEAQGLSSLFPMSDLTVFGLAELLPKIPKILERIRETVAAIRAQKPDVVVTIDAPDFCFRVAKKLVGSDIPFVHYVAPTVWAWRPGRALKIQPLLKHLLALFPFEPPYFEKVDLPCTFVGHPLVEAGIEHASGERIRAKYEIAHDREVMVILPGSRRSELSKLLPDFEQVIAALKVSHPQLKIIVPTLPHYYDRMRDIVKNWAFSDVLVTTSDEDKYDAFKAARCALAASGTVALELGLAGTPAVIAYKVHPITAGLYRRFIKTKFANLVNIMAGRMAVPEFIQENCTPANLGAAVNTLLNNNDVRAEQIAVLDEVRGWLSVGNGKSPSQAAAQTVLTVARAK